MKAWFMLLAVLPTLGWAQDKWNVITFAKEAKPVKFTVTEGTWMNVDLSPDGSEIVFDLLGDIYSMPAAGGKAKKLRSGHAFEVQPRFSPDGSKILFTSDAGGGDNIWMMDKDGKNPKQITKEDFRLLNNGVWMPDGKHIIARKHFSSTRSLGAGEMWLYPMGGGPGLQLTKKKNDQQDVNEPCVSPDGKYLYFSEDMYPGGYFQYNKDPNNQIFVIKRLDLQKGETETITGGPGGACRPQISKDGKKLAFVRRVRTQTVLYIHNLETGEEWPVYNELSKDQQEAWTIFGIYTGFSWAADNQNIIAWAKGKIRKINIESKQATEIPFEAECEHSIVEALKFKQDPHPKTFNAKAIRQAVTSPDGKFLVFNAAGYLWKKQLPDGKPERLNPGTELQFEPAFSPDGNKLVFVTWDDEKLGQILVMDLNSKGISKINEKPGIFRTPSFSADGQKIVYIREEGNDHQGFAFSNEPGMYVCSAEGKNHSKISKEGEWPQFSKDNQYIYYQTGGYYFGGLNKAWKRYHLTDKTTQTIFTSKYANRFVLSPDNQFVAFNELHKVFVAEIPAGGFPVDLSADTKSFPISQCAKGAGINVHWSGDSKKIHWTLGEEYFSSELKNRFLFYPGAPDSLPGPDSVGIKINLSLQAEIPTTKFALVHGTILSISDSVPLVDGVVLVNGNRIEKIGKFDSVKIPEGYETVDCSGKTLMPGLVDVHAHLGTFRYGLSPQKHWPYWANLAYGVTTTHDPSSNTEMVFSQSEMVKTGTMVGPRVFSTGIILYGADGDFKAPISSIEDARFAIKRTAAFGAFSVKSYNQPRREQRQQVIQAARENKIMVYPEGGSFFYHNLSMILDGHTGIEHNLPVAPVYNDVVQLWKNARTGYTPTLIVNYGGVNGEYYWYQKTNVWEKTRLLNFTPRSVIDTRSRHRTMVPDEEYQNGHILVSQSCKKLSDAGVKVNLGAHGQIQGIGAHWELWMLQQGGMSNYEALRSATLNGAAYIGMDKDLGSLEAGKLADMLILDKNPMENIQNSESIKYVMINGHLYDAETLTEKGKQASKFWWQNEKYAGFGYHEAGETHHQGHCSCGK